MSRESHNSRSGRLARSLSRGLDRLDFLPAVLVVLVFFGGVFGLEFLKKWNPRDPVDFSLQFEALEKNLQAWGTETGVKVRVPDREAWQVRSFGDVDEWRGSVWVGTPAKPGEENEMPIVLEFNMTRRGLEPRRME